MIVFTIGHSSHTTETFLALLKQHHIACLVDVRSSPYSRYAPQFNREALAAALQSAGLTYRFAGDHLGGKPKDITLHGDSGAPDYDRMAASPLFQKGLDRLCQLAAAEPTVILCSEADPAACHRERLVGRALRARGVTVRHIMPDGSLTETRQETLF